MGLADAAIGDTGERSEPSTSAAFGHEHYCHKPISCKSPYRHDAGVTASRWRAPISAVTLGASVSSYVSSLSKTQQMRRCGKLDRRTVENSRCVKRTAIEWNFVQAGGRFREYASLHGEKVVTARRDLRGVRYGATGAAKRTAMQYDNWRRSDDDRTRPARGKPTQKQDSAQAAAA
jgi:hypothetical protein